MPIMVMISTIAVLAAGCVGKPSLSGPGGASTGTPDTKWYSVKPKAKAFTISNADQLAGLAQIVNGAWGGTPAKDNFLGKTVKLAGDIDLSHYSNWTPIGGWNPAANASQPFSGTFDGGGYVISNLTINSPDAKDQGLFGCVERGKVKNLGLKNINITGGSSVGGLAGTVWFNSSVAGVYTTGSITAAVSHAGGIAGVVVDNSSISNSLSAAKVSSGDHAGGIAGRIGGNSGITSCAALNPSVKATEIDAKIGRVVGSTADSNLGSVTLSDNVALDEMKYNDGDAEWHKTGHNMPNGADISAAEVAADPKLGGRFKAGWKISP
jgi:hypothetical protein